jgi:hypothetical protein
MLNGPVRTTGPRSGPRTDFGPDRIGPSVLLNGPIEWFYDSADQNYVSVTLHKSKKGNFCSGEKWKFRLHKGYTNFIKKEILLILVEIM